MIAGRHVDILEAVARFGYLTPNQMLGLGLYSDKSSLYAALDALSGRGLLARTEPVSKFGMGRFPGVYALTRSGAEMAGLALDEAVRPLRGARSSEPPLDAEHRTAIVEVHIALAAWAEAEGHSLQKFLPDFAPSGQRGRRATAIPTPHGDYTPDALAVLACGDGIMRPLVIEVYRGGLSGRSSYLRRKLPADLRAFHTPEVAKSLCSDGSKEWSAPRLVVVVETDRLRKEILAVPPEPALLGWGFAYFKALPDLKPDFRGGWWRSDGHQEALF